jgi:hypothetical protein
MILSITDKMRHFHPSSEDFQQKQKYNLKLEGRNRIGGRTFTDLEIYYIR